MSDSLRPHGLQHTRLPCLSPNPGACSNLCPLSRGCHTTISSSVIPFSSWLQSFPASGPFLMSQLFAPGGQSIGASASATVLPKNIQHWFPLGWTGWIFLQSKELSECSPTLQFKSINSSVLNVEGNGNPLQCSCLENPRDGRAWWAAIYGVAQSQTWLKRLSSSSSKIRFRLFILG